MKPLTSANRRSSAQHATRRFLVLGTLCGVLMLTSALLLALAPAPLSPEVSSSLFAITTPDSMDEVFQTQVRTPQNRWNYIYIHHSNTPAGNALTLAQAGGGDHFVIGNGDGCMDGEIQISQRWDHQLSALPPAGVANLDPSCISIGLIGDFDLHQPTSTQLRRLSQLVGTLQDRYRIDPQNILMVSGTDTPAAIGKAFPIQQFRQQLAH